MEGLHISSPLSLCVCMYVYVYVCMHVCKWVPACVCVLCLLGVLGICASIVRALSVNGRSPWNFFVLQQIWMRIVLYIGIGLAIVSFFSDPMVDVISNFGGQINVGGFYV